MYANDLWVYYSAAQEPLNKLLLLARDLTIAPKNNATQEHNNTSLCASNNRPNNNNIIIIMVQQCHVLHLLIIT